VKNNKSENAIADALLIANNEKRKIAAAVNGFRAITKKAMTEIDTDAIYFDIEIQMTMRCARKKFKIAEIPTIEFNRVEGEGKLSTTVDGYRYLKLIIQEYFR